jgi:hypothetical protein
MIISVDQKKLRYDTETDVGTVDFRFSIGGGGDPIDETKFRHVCGALSIMLREDIELLIKLMAFKMSIKETIIANKNNK